MLDRLPTLLLVPHADAGDRRTWTTDQDLRPLSDLGRSQAAALSDEIGAVDRIISSPARRCVETVQPIADRSGIRIELDDDLRETSFIDEIDAWDPWQLDPVWRAQLVASAAIGRAMRVLTKLADTDVHEPRHRVVLSAHGDLIPMLAMLVAGFHRVPGPHPAARGGAYAVDPRNATHPIMTIGALVPAKTR